MTQPQRARARAATVTPYAEKKSPPVTEAGITFFLKKKKKKKKINGFKNLKNGNFKWIVFRFFMRLVIQLPSLYFFDGLNTTHFVIQTESVQIRLWTLPMRKPLGPVKPNRPLLVPTSLQFSSFFPCALHTHSIRLSHLYTPLLFTFLHVSAHLQTYAHSATASTIIIEWVETLFR